MSAWTLTLKATLTANCLQLGLAVSQKKLAAAQYQRRPDTLYHWATHLVYKSTYTELAYSTPRHPLLVSR